MSILDSNIILASKSPRRRELFSLITDRYRCIAPDVDESGVTSGDARQLSVDLARLKASQVFSENPNTIVVGCDTVVEVDGRVLGKPRDKEEARTMLHSLSGRRHNVYTGVCVLGGGHERAFACHTSVEFYPIPPVDLERYIATNDPYDKAGGYGVQGMAACFVRGIRGDYFNVMGLPVSRLYNTLKELGCI